VQSDLVILSLVERERDAVVETEASDGASKMIQQLTALRGIGVQSATVLVREAFVRTTYAELYATSASRSEWSGR
jgi:hypothetical protein